MKIIDDVKTSFSLSEVEAAMEYVERQPIYIGDIGTIKVYVRRDVCGIQLVHPDGEKVWANVNNPYLRGTKILEAALKALDGE